MNKFITSCVHWIIKLALKVRYRWHVKGLEKINPENLNPDKGILFLPNHPSYLDPAIVSIALYKKFKPRPLTIEYMYYTPWLHGLLRRLRALPIPNFEDTHNTLKMKRGERAFQRLFQALRKRDNLLLYPSGKVKHTAVEVVGGASGVHKILQEMPDVNIVLVRTTGFWGSMFSRALTGKAPSLGGNILKGLKIALKNLIFFTPKRDIDVEFEVNPSDFPYHSSRLEINKYLEEWYNKPFIDREGKRHGEPLKLISYSAWRKELPEVTYSGHPEQIEFDLDQIPHKIKKKVVAELAKMSNRLEKDVTPESDLAADLGLDSLDAANILLFIEEEYRVSNIAPEDLTTVGSVMAIAARQYEKEDTANLDDEKEYSDWFKDEKRCDPEGPKGSTLQEAFLRICDKMGKTLACADDMTGTVTYRDLKLRVLLLADYIQDLPGDKIGIMLPASIGANILVLATLMAKKVPVMVNWTVGPRHLETVIAATNLQHVLTSWKFVERLHNVDFNGIEDKVVMLEDLRPQFTLKSKLKAFWNSKKSADTLLDQYGIGDVHEDDPAVLLFTSGTEGMPKGVPLSHKNILSNIRESIKVFQFYHYDVLYAVLPPFHSFGFTACGLLPILSGIRSAFSPDPTDSARLARGIKRWGITVMISAPSFMKGIFQVGTKEQLESVRLFVTGAEKTPKDLFDKVDEMGTDAQLIEGYGITECSPVISINRADEEPKGVGKPIPGVELAVIDPESHEILPQGERGLVLVTGPNVFNGYLEGTSTRSPFIEMEGKRWYDTGDLGILDEEGNLILAGRLKRFTKIGGEMLSLGALEEAVAASGQRHNWYTPSEGPDLAVIALEKEGQKTELYLFSTFKVTVDEINKGIREQGFSNLARFKDVIECDEIPLTGTGKVNYRKLEERLS
ncbi:MAG: AMP-binding protein [Chlamydiota bacterium]